MLVGGFEERGNFFTEEVFIDCNK